MLTGLLGDLPAERLSVVLTAALRHLPTGCLNVLRSRFDRFLATQNAAPLRLRGARVARVAALGIALARLRRAARAARFGLDG